MSPPNSPADAGEPAPPGAKRRPLQGGKELHAAQRSENDGGVPPIHYKTTAWPLALAVICLVVYASLYPFTDWRNQGISPLRFLLAPLPQYWTGFDIGINLLGYAPVGFLLALSALRSGRFGWAVTVATLSGALLSLSMETMQSYLPSRIPSNVDLLLNSLGAWLGALVALLLERMGAVNRWSHFRARWLAPDARGALVLLALWPVALLFPTSLPLGLGQVFERIELALAEALVATPFLDWLPVRDVELQPLVPAAELVCVALGGLIPCLLGYGVIRGASKRVLFAATALAMGVLTTALSQALSYGPEHAWAWLDLPVQAGLAGAAILALLLLLVPRRGAAAFALLALAVQLVLLNQAPVDPYFEQTLQVWEQGRFIRFHGVAQWVGWAWPFAALLYVLVRLSGGERHRPKIKP